MRTFKPRPLSNREVDKTFDEFAHDDPAAGIVLPIEEIERPVDPIVELADACLAILDVLDILVVEMPRAKGSLDGLRDRLYRLR